jgi:hypothetical protein
MGKYKVSEEVYRGIFVKKFTEAYSWKYKVLVAIVIRLFDRFNPRKAGFKLFSDPGKNIDNLKARDCNEAAPPQQLYQPPSCSR